MDGEVKRPAIYELKGERTVSEVLKLAGGLLASTSTSTVQLIRYDQNQKKVVLQINASKASDLARPLQDGDFVRVRKISGPLDNNVQVIGFIRYPGAYEWTAGYDLAQLLQSAQVLPSESGRETYLPMGLIERTNVDSGVRSWIGFNTREVVSGSAAVPLQRDDLVVILSRNDVEYLNSRSVRAVVTGDLKSIRSCPALQELASVANSARSIRFVTAFEEEATRTDVPRHRAVMDAQASPEVQGRASTASAMGQDQDKFDLHDERPCPDVFDQAPSALPYLLEQSVAVYGEVRRPGLYPIAPNTPVTLLIDTAGGLSNESDPRNIEYISYADAMKDGHSNYRVLDLSQSKALISSPGDVFNVKPLYLGQEVGTVKAGGEFRFPASYGILRGEKLSELMKRAGGITENAYPFGAVFTRASARKAEEESYRRAATDLQEAMVTAVTSGALGNNAQISSQFLSSVVQRLQNAEAVGRVVIQADASVLEAHPELDPILEPGDAIFMPKKPISVTVIGQVLNPGTLGFIPEASAKQYVNWAGGYTQAADSGRAFVILPNGTAEKVQSSFWNTQSRNIPPGSIVVVPRDAAPFNVMGFSERIFGVLSNLALTAAALATISRN